MEKIKGFKWRGMFTFLVVLALVVDAVSGIILYIAPPGRVANWTNWQVWGLGKDQWGAMERNGWGYFDLSFYLHGRCFMMSELLGFL